MTSNFFTLFRLVKKMLLCSKKPLFDVQEAANEAVKRGF